MVIKLRPFWLQDIFRLILSAENKNISSALGGLIPLRARPVFRDFYLFNSESTVSPYIVCLFIHQRHLRKKCAILRYLAPHN